jgi:hypothetical protein
MYFKWTVFFTKHRPFTIALQIDPGFLTDRFVSAQAVRTSPDWNEFLIPHVEAWYDGTIPVSEISSSLIVMPGETPVWASVTDPGLRELIEKFI